MKKETNGLFEKKPVANEAGILVILWRQFLVETGIINKIGMLVQNHEKEKELSKLDNNSTIDKSKTKSTLIADISSDKMSIKVLFYLLFMLVRVKKVRLTLECEFPNGHKSSTSIVVNNPKERKETETTETKENNDGNTVRENS